MKYAAVAFFDSIKNQVLLTLDAPVTDDEISLIARNLSRENKTVVQIFIYDQRVLTVSAI
jgi:hypothetical protein